MFQPFDPTGISYLMPGQKPSQSQQRQMAIFEYMNQFKDEDQLLMVTPSHGPEALKRMNPEEAAKMIYDKQARLATDEEKEAYETQNKVAYNAIQKDLAKKDLAQAVRTVLND